MKKTKLILGAAGHRHDDALTLDIDEKHSPDVVHDLNNLPWPFKENQFKEIVCHHVLEHLHEIDGAMKELHRICAADGSIYIEVPHHTSWCANVPEHYLRFNYFAFDGYLVEGKEQKWITTEKKFLLVSRKITFHRSFRRVLLHTLFNRFPDAYERFWTYIFPAEHIKFVIQPLKKD